jgi:hypothetical protein
LPNCLCGLRSERRTINKPSSTHGRPQPKAQAHVMNRPDRVQSGISPIIWEARGASTDAW